MRLLPHIAELMGRTMNPYPRRGRDDIPALIRRGQDIRHLRSLGYEYHREVWLWRTTGLSCGIHIALWSEAQQCYVCERFYASLGVRTDPATVIRQCTTTDGKPAALWITPLSLL